MQPVKTIVDTAWTDIKARFAALATVAGLPVPVFARGVADWFSRMKYPAMFLTLDYVAQETESMLGENLSVVLNLVIVHTAAKPEKLETQMTEYIDAMLELIRNDHTFGGACQIGEFVASDLYAGAQDGRDLSIAIITLRLRKEVEI